MSVIFERLLLLLNVKTFFFTDVLWKKKNRGIISNLDATNKSICGFFKCACELQGHWFLHIREGRQKIRDSVVSRNKLFEFIVSFSQTEKVYRLITS